MGGPNTPPDCLILEKAELGGTKRFLWNCCRIPFQLGVTQKGAGRQNPNSLEDKIPTVWKTKSQQFGRQNPNSLEDKIPTVFNYPAKTLETSNIWVNLGDLGASKETFIERSKFFNQNLKMKDLNVEPIWLCQMDKSSVN